VTLRLLILILGLLPGCAAPLPSWNAGGAKTSVLAFVDAATERGGPGYIDPSQRIAVFDNDGTLWAEQPMYFQLAFAIDRITKLAPEHPEWQREEPFASVLRGDLNAALAGGEHAILEIVMASHAGMTVDAFSDAVSEWVATAEHPRFGRPYTELVYQPMLELLDLLRDNGFETWIVSGGGIDFMRVFAEEVYGIPPQQVIGSSIVTRFELRDGEPVLVREPKLDFLDDKAGKPVAIQRFIGRRPVLAFGNSDGDHQMLQWTAAGPGPHLVGLVHHTDTEREWAYDRDSKIGRLDVALDDAQERGWTVINMQADWLRVFAAPQSSAPLK
jgi:phosphoglycolate phosphatase-like HAD superfamily hydrolase